MGLSLRNAAKEAGVSKSTILRAIQSGRLSAARLEDGGYDIDPAELFRVYEPGKAERSAPEAKGQDAPAGPDLVLQEQLNSLRELLRRADEDKAEMRQEREDLKQDRDKWRSMAESQQRQLTDNRPKGFWQRLTG